MTRGEVAGGKWGTKLVFFGGLIVSLINIVALSDTHYFDLNSHVFQSLSTANGSPNKPRERFSHAAAVTGDNLIVYGGRAMSSNSWYLLNDVWQLNLNTQVWTELDMQVPISRSYHSLVGESRFNHFWSFGGYKTVSTARGDIAYVFSDLMRGTQDDDKWYKFTPQNNTQNTIEVRFQHSAVYYDSTIFVYGGR